MVADKKQIQIFGYNESFTPYHIVTYNIDQTNEEIFKADRIQQPFSN